MEIRPVTFDLNYLKSRLVYYPSTGFFRWRPVEVSRLQDASWNVKYAGRLAGSFTKTRKYVTILLDGRAYGAHRIAWFYMTGTDPDREIDHKDTDKKNNKWNNLRLATPSQNRMNKSMLSNNTSGFKGVSWRKSSEKWVANVCLNGKQKHIGLFDTAEKAYSAYLIAASNLHGEFARG